jgi:hypothetical protein
MNSIKIKTVLLVTVLSVSTADASTLLYGTDVFDPATGFYTYSYAVENNSSSTIFEVNILVGNAALGTFNGFPIPPSHTAPSGWTMNGAVSGSIASPPYNEAGGFYQWSGGTNLIQPGTNAFGFSVTTSFAPTLANGLNDYFLYGSPEGVVAFGNVVVPNGANSLTVSPVPLPGAFPLFATGLGALGLLARYRKRKTKEPVTHAIRESMLSGLARF